VGNVLHHVKERENCPGGKCPGKIRLGEMGDICPRENVQGECPDPSALYLKRIGDTGVVGFVSTGITLSDCATRLSSFTMRLYIR